MPTSLINGKVWTGLLFRSISHYAGVKRVLDIGPGRGTYAFFKQPHQHWACVEAWGPYIEEFKLTEQYNEVITADIRYVDFVKLGKFDVTFIGDVLEHMSKEDAVELIDKLLIYSRFIIISLPIVKFPQDAVNGNFFEIHVKDDWSHQEMIDTFPNIYIHKIEDPIGVYCMAGRNGDAHLLRSFSEALGNTK